MAVRIDDEAERARVRKSAPAKVRGRVLKDDPVRRTVLAEFEPVGAVSVDDVESLAWAAVPRGGRPQTGAVKVLESYIFRGPDWQMDAGGTERTIKNGSWLAAFGLDKKTWSAYRAGAFGPDDALRAIANPEPSNDNIRKEVPMSKKSEVLKASEANALLGHALQKMAQEAVEAERIGERWRADSIRKESAEIRLALAEKAYLNAGQISQYGPGRRPLFARTGHLADDTAVHGI